MKNVCKLCGSILRRKCGRRVDPTVKANEAGQHDDEYQVFLKAVEEYKLRSHRRFLLHSDYLVIVKELGYERKPI